MALAAVAALSLSACGSDSVDLAGQSFTSTGSTGHDLVAGSQVKVSFEEGTISVNAGCNTMNGSASWADGVLDVEEPLAMTMMACEQELMDQDQWLSSFLTSSPPISVDGDTLQIGDDAESLSLQQD